MHRSIDILLKVLLIALVLGLFIYPKLVPYKDRLTPGYRKIYNFFDAFLGPVLNFLRSAFKPLQVGPGVGVDVAQLILLIFLLVLLM